MKVNHVQIATENLVRCIVELQATAKALNHQHASDHILFLAKGINFVYRGGSKLYARLLKLEVGSASAIQQRKHRAKTGTHTKAHQRSVHTIKCHIEIRTVFRLGFEVEDGHLVKELFHPIGRIHIHLLALPDGIEHQLCHRCKVLAGNTLVDVLTFYIYILILNDVLAGAVVLLALHHRHRPTKFFILLCIRRTGIHTSVRQQTEESVKFAPFSFGCFKCHGLFSLSLTDAKIGKRSLKI